MGSGEVASTGDFKGAEEFLRLNDSVDALASAVRLQERQQELEQQLQQSQKLEAIGRLAGGVAHDFNNLLTVILGYAETLGEDKSLGEVSQNSAKQIILAGERAAGLTRQLLAFSRKQVLRSELVDPVEVLQGMREMLDRLIGERVEVTVDVRGPVGLVSIDSSQFEQVIMNLAVNSRDAMEQGGELEFALYHERVEVGALSASGILPVIPPDPTWCCRCETMDPEWIERSRSEYLSRFSLPRKLGKGADWGLPWSMGS